MFALGYCQAEDRLEQLFFNYRRAIGRTAEVLGSAHVDHDLVQRTWRHEEVARQYVEREAPTEVVAWVRAFQDGVRLWMREHPDRIPPNAMEIAPHHAFALGRFIVYGWQLSQVQNELGRVSGAQPRLYSNQWAVSPQRVAENCAVLLIDPHLPWEGEMRFYENHVNAGALNTCGFSVVGTPGIGLGHNARLGWACTTGGPDTVDIYEFPRNPNHPWQYRHGQGWRDVVTEEVQIPCRQADGSIKQVTRKIHRTHLGPLIYDTPQKLYAARTAYDDQAGMLTQIYRMNRARTMREFLEAIAMLQFMDQNIMGADVAGNIYYVRNGRVPLRAPGFDWSRPVPGEDPRTEWRGFHAQKDLIQIINPPTGYMQNCNVAPDAMAHVPLIKASDYSREIFHAAPGDTHTRGLRANELLSRHDRLTREQAMAIVTDTELPGVADWKRLLRQVRAALSNDTDATDLLRILDGWNGRVDRGEAGATAFEALVHELLDLGAWGQIAPQNIARVQTLDPSRAQTLTQAVRKAAARLKQTCGKVEVKWGDIHKVGRTGSWPVDGAGIRFYATLRPVGYGPSGAGGMRKAVSGQSHVMLIFFKPGAVESFSVTPFGISDQPDSPHYEDQTEKLFAQNRLKSTFFGAEALRGNVAATKELVYRP